MKLKGTYEIVSIGDEVTAVPVEETAEEFHGVFRMNAAAAEVFELLKNEITEEEIVNTLAANYENDRAELTTYIRDILKDFSENGLL